MAILKVNNLSCVIDNKVIIDDISFSIERKTINAFLSSNNSCKTTLIKTLSGITYASYGTISVNNILLKKDNFSKYIRYISTILSDIDDSFLCDTVEEEIKYPLINLKYLKKDINAQFNYISNLLKIKSIKDKKIKELSSYEKIKVLLAASIIHKPKVLFIDDLLRFLNNKEKKEIISLFHTIKNELNVSIVFTTSNLEDTYELDNIYVLKDGKILMNDSYENIIQKDNELSKIGIDIPLMVDLSRKLEFYGLINTIYYDRDKVVDQLWK